MLDAPSAADASARPQLPPDPATASVSVRPAPSASDALFAAARTLLPVLEAGRPLDAGTLRDAMTRAFGATDAEGAWLWKDAYEAAEAAVVLFVQRYGRAMRKQTGAGPDGPRHMLAMLDAVAALEPSHTKRSEEQIRLQQFSTPLPLAYAALRAAAIRPGDTVLEPSAGTGMLAVMAECAMGNRAAGSLYLNEYAHTRAHLLTHLFPQAVTTAFNAEAIADRLHDVTPTAVIMNPPFSATPGVDRIRHDADLRHIRSAFSMLPPGGRLVTITSANCIPGDAAWRDTFDSVDGGACTVFTMAIDGRAYARRGTGFDTRLTVLERSAKPEIDIDREARAADAAELLDTVIAQGAAQAADYAGGRSAHPGRPGTGPVRQGGQAAGHEGQHRRQFRCHACDRPRLGTCRRARRRDRRPRHRYARIGHAGECRPLRTVAAGRRAGAGRHRPSHAAGAVRRHGRGAASRADLPAGAARTRGGGRAPVGRATRKRRACGRGPLPPSRRRLPHRCGLGDGAALPGGGRRR